MNDDSVPSGKFRTVAICSVTGSDRCGLFVVMYDVSRLSREFILNNFTAERLSLLPFL